MKGKSAAFAGRIRIRRAASALLVLVLTCAMLVGVLAADGVLPEPDEPLPEAGELSGLVRETWPEEDPEDRLPGGNPEEAPPETPGLEDPDEGGERPAQEDQDDDEEEDEEEDENPGSETSAGIITVNHEAVEITGYRIFANLSRNWTIQQATPGERHFIVRDGGTLSLDGITLDGMGSGGGVLVESGGALILQNGAAILNCKSTRGGAVHALGGTVTLEQGTTLSGNSATQYGGGVCLEEGATLIIQEGEIAGNRAAEHGGGIYLSPDFGNALEMNGGTLSGNSAGGNGGGVYLATATATEYALRGDDVTIALNQGLLCGNRAQGDGGAIYASTLDRVEAGQAIRFADNAALNGARLLTDQEYIELHNRKILTPQYSFTGSLQYAYNNFDISLMEGPAVTWHTVRFDPGGGSPTPAPQTVGAGGLLTQPTAPSLSGHRFVGWFAEGAEDAWDFANNQVWESFTLFARYEEQESVPSTTGGSREPPITTRYIVSFDAQGGSPSPADQYVTHGGTASEPQAPEKEGYTFQAWVLGSGVLAFDYDFDLPVYGSITLRARYEEIPSYEIEVEALYIREAVDRRPARGQRPPTLEEFLAELAPEGAGQPVVRNSRTGVAVDPAGVRFRSESFEAVDFSRPGDQSLTLTAAVAGGGEAEAALTLRVVDTVPPQLEAQRRLSLEGAVGDMGTLLTLAGASVSDNCDETVAIRAEFLGITLGEIDWSSSGVYLLYLEAADSSGNQAQRKVVIVEVKGGAGA